MEKIIPIGTEIKPFGLVVMIGFVGERYYWLKNKQGVISMLPASLIEKKGSRYGKDER